MLRPTLRSRLARFAIPVAVLHSACTVGPDYEPPAIEAPPQWRNASAQIASAEERNPAWWQNLKDPILEEIVRRAESDNIGIMVAVNRIQEARSQYGVTRSELWPTLDAVGSFRRVRTSQNGTNNRVSGFQFQDRNLWSVGFELNWELDLWGRVQRMKEAGVAEVQASVEDLRDLVVVLQAEVVSTYIDVRSIQASLAILGANIAIQRQSLEQARSKFEAGLVQEVDVLQAETQLATTQSQQPSLRTDLETSLNRLALLLGERPGALHEQLESPQPIPIVPATLRVPVPADHLRQRPDVRSSERRLAAATARVGVQVADYYPQFSLFGSFGWEATTLGNLTRNDSQAFTFGPFLRWNLFNAGRTAASVDVAEARVEQALKTHQETVLRAWNQVEVALFADTEGRSRISQLESAVTSARRAADSVHTLYENGLATYVQVLESHRARLSVEILRAQARSDLARNFVSLYRALGGGWVLPSQESADSEKK